MENTRIQALLSELSWNMPQETQKKARADLLTLLTEENLSVLLQPHYKDCWDNAALILREIGYPKYEKIIHGLLNWLQDMNWPGAWIIFESLLTIRPEILTLYIEKAVLEAVKTNDGLWLEALKALVEDAKITANHFSSPEIYQVLEAVE